MGNSRLYIIGNGFDLFHEIKSAYSDFKNYVEQNDEDLFNTLDNYFDIDELWSDFEETLAYINTENITDDASNYLVPYASDDWSESDNHNYPEEIQRAIDIVTVQLKENFIQWILQLNVTIGEKLKLDKSAKYLNFNYTNTLEKVYKIDSSNVLYIHNKALNKASILILGHSREPATEGTYSLNDDEDTDVRVAEGNRILDKYFEDTYKNTEVLIEENKVFFSSLNEINEVFILGHSISNVDIRYFEEVKKRIKVAAVWSISFYGGEQKEENKKKIIDIGIDEAHIKMITLDELKK
jgi:hypothetical protein